MVDRKDSVRHDKDAMNSASTHLLLDILSPFKKDLDLKAANHQPIQWKKIAEVVRHAGLAGLLRKNALAKGLTLPAPIDRQLAINSLAAQRQTKLLLNLADQIASLAEEKRLALVSLKGISLVRSIYPKLGLRGMADIDLFVAKHHYPYLVQLIKNLGLKSISENQARHDHDQRFILEKKGLDLFVELHWTPFYEYGDRIQIQNAIARRKRTKKGVLDQLDLEDNLLVLALHVAHNRSVSSLRTLVDIAYTYQIYQSKIRLNELIERANLLGASGALYYALSMTQNLLSSPAILPFDFCSHSKCYLINRLSRPEKRIFPPQPLSSLPNRLATDLLLLDHPLKQQRYLFNKAISLFERYSPLQLPDFLVRSPIAKKM